MSTKGTDFNALPASISRLLTLTLTLFGVQPVGDTETHHWLPMGNSNPNPNPNPFEVVPFKYFITILHVVRQHTFRDKAAQMNNDVSIEESTDS